MKLYVSSAHRLQEFTAQAICLNDPARVILNYHSIRQTSARGTAQLEANISSHQLCQHALSSSNMGYFSQN